VAVTQRVLSKADCRLNGQPFVLRHPEELRRFVSCVTGKLLSRMVRRSLFTEYLLACSVDLRVGCRAVLCDGPCDDVSPFNTDANWLMEARPCVRVAVRRVCFAWESRFRRELSSGVTRVVEGTAE